MIVAIHQPDYIPWLGYFYKMANCDVFVYLDDVQYSNTAAHNFNVIKSPQGEVRLKIPVKQTMGDSINQVLTKDELGWKTKHLQTIAYNYKKSKYFDLIYPEFEKILSISYLDITNLNVAINDYICRGFGIKPNIVFSSEMVLSTCRQQRIIDICKQLNADIYLSGNGAKVYQDENEFLSQGILLNYNSYKPIVYPQLWGSFIPCLSVLDYIFNMGFDWNYVDAEVRKQ